MDFNDEDGWGRPGFVFWTAGLAISLLSGAFAYFRLPAGAQIPMQVNASGAPIHFADKGYVLFSIPLVMAGLALVMDVVPFMPRPRREISMLGKYLAMIILLFAQLFGVWMAFKWHRA